MTQQQLRELIRASNPVSSPGRLLPQDQDVRTLFEEVMHRTGNPQPSADPLAQPVERRRDMQTQDKPIQIVPEVRSSRSKGRLIPALAGALAVIVIAVGAWAFTRSTEPDFADGSPLQVTDSGDSAAATALKAYASAYNAGDIDAVMAFFTDASVVTGYPGAGPATGTSEVLSNVSEIRVVHEQELSNAANPTFRVSNIATQGSAITWDYRWTADGFCFVGEGHSAQIEEGKILSWTWPDLKTCG